MQRSKNCLKKPLKAWWRGRLVLSSGLTELFETQSRNLLIPSLWDFVKAILCLKSRIEICIDQSKRNAMSTSSTPQVENCQNKRRNSETIFDRIRQNWFWKREAGLVEVSIAEPGDGLWNWQGQFLLYILCKRFTICYGMSLLAMECGLILTVRTRPGNNACFKHTLDTR